MAVPAGKFFDSIVLWRSRGEFMKRREFLSLLAGTVAPWPTFAFAQQNQAAKRIGLMANLPLPPVERFREKLQKLGWVEGKNLIVEYRYGEGKR
jgi:putative ABC transport system substrate-binding protein